MPKKYGFYLVALQSVKKRDADDGRPDPRLVGEGGEAGGLHLDVLHAVGMELLQVLQLVLLLVLAKGAVKSTLP